VASNQKIHARKQLVAELLRGGFENKEILVRINDLHTSFWQDDFRAFPNIDGIVVPKINAAHELLQLLPQVTVPVWIMGETPLGMLNLPGIVEAGCQSKHGKLAGIILGSNDLSFGLRVPPHPERLGLALSLYQTVLVARAYNVEAIDGVYNDIKNMEGLRHECLQGLALGFSGKSVIHPEQIDIVNQVFTPSAEQVSKAKQIIEAFSLAEREGKAVTTQDGKMIEELHVREAKRVLSMMERAK